ncbi:MAG: protease adaptor protein RcdA [Asticcacaulis sp.]
MSDNTAPALNLRVRLLRDFASSDLFDRTFKEGMALVEETAAYLDGDGRRDSRLLTREDALLYAGESMRLTTRLMQIASWLLVQRAVREGDMDANDACDEKYRITPLSGDSSDNNRVLPEGLLSLLDRSNRLYERISHLDRRMFIDQEPAVDEVNPVLTQLQRLQTAFQADI